MNELKTKMFIDKAIKIHSNRYSYVKTKYVKSSLSVTIICQLHGDFEQTPNNHLTGQGCPKCGMLKRIDALKGNLAWFVERARTVHGDTYDYSKSVYVNNDTKVIIGCKVHGDFTQSPGNHILGAGCLICGYDRSAELARSNTQAFIEKAKTVHGDTYDYSRVIYLTALKKVTISCVIHGDFIQTPNSHLNGNGCPGCSSLKISNRLKSNTETFIEKAKTVHGDTYDYSKVAYTLSNSKVTIGCKLHGDFIQTPNSHLNGNGCTVCNASKGELAIAKILKKNGIEFIREYVIPNSNTRYRYDFYIPSLSMLIEFHGKQHYIPIDYFGGEAGFLSTTIRDDVKRTLAKVWGYKLFEVNYTHFLHLSEEDFEKKLLKNIKIPKPLSRKKR